MVIQGKEGLVKRDALILFGAVIVIGLLVYVFANIEGVVQAGNYSSTLNFSCNTTTANVSFAILLYNESGGNASTYLTNVTNTSAWQTRFENESVDISGLPDALKLYNLTCLVQNITGSLNSSSVFNVTIDNTPPAVNFTETTNTINNGNYTNTTFVINVSISDATIGMGTVYINVSYSNGSIPPRDNWTQASSSTAPFYNTTINATGYPDGYYNITVFANDSEFLTNASGDTVVNVNDSEYLYIAIDTTAPTVTLTKASSTKSSITLTIASSDATTGVLGSCRAIDREYAIVDGTSLTEGGLACGTSYSFTVACDDYMGNTGTVTGSFSTDNCGGGTSGGTSGTTSPSTTSVSTVNPTPTSPATISNFASSSGLKEIKLEVSEVANSVKVTVEDYETNKPSEVLASVSGAYKYLNIETQNLANKLSKATMKIQVEKSWINGQGITKEDVILFKYDETANKWNELITTYDSEDDSYYYYTVELTSFSYFAIAPKGASIVPEGEEEPTTSGGEEGGFPTWAWIIIVLVIVVLIGGGIALKKRK